MCANLPTDVHNLSAKPIVAKMSPVLELLVVRNKQTNKQSARMEIFNSCCSLVNSWHMRYKAMNSLIVTPGHIGQKYTNRLF
jgi:hypothetical protein